MSCFKAPPRPENPIQGLWTPELAPGCAQRSSWSQASVLPSPAAVLASSPSPRPLPRHSSWALGFLLGAHSGRTPVLPAPQGDPSESPTAPGHCETEPARTPKEVVGRARSWPCGIPPTGRVSATCSVQNSSCVGTLSHSLPFPGHRGPPASAPLAAMHTHRSAAPLPSQPLLFPRGGEEEATRGSQGDAWKTSAGDKGDFPSPALLRARRGAWHGPRGWASPKAWLEGGGGQLRQEVPQEGRRWTHRCW